MLKDDEILTFTPDADFWNNCATVKYYYVIEKVLEEDLFHTLTEPFCVVESEDVARHFCAKHPQYIYTKEEIVYYGNENF